MTKIDYTKLSYSQDVVDVVISVRKSFPIKQFGDKTVYAPVSQFPRKMLETALHEGLARVLNDGVGNAKLSDTDKIAKQSKRLDAIMSGSWHVTEREAPVVKFSREAYIMDQQGKHPGSSVDAIEKLMKTTVKQQLGDNINATFDNVLLAIAKQVAERKGETRTQAELHELLWAKWEKAGMELKAEREAAGAGVEIDLTDIDI